MGGKPSKSAKPELTRTKSISTIGRSSQRYLFQKSKARLGQINKKLQKFDGTKQSANDEIKQQLEDVEQDLNGISETIKEKNKQKYEEILKYFQETRQKFEQKIKPTEEVAKVEDIQEPEEVAKVKDVQEPEEVAKAEGVQEPAKLETVGQPVEIKLVRVSSTEHLDVDIRKPLNEEDLEKSPKVKFGIQVMPVNPRVSQELLKRKTLPINEAPKAEFLQIRKMSGEVSPIDKQNQENYELYNNSMQGSCGVKIESLENFDQHHNSGKVSIPSSPNPDTQNAREKPLKVLEKRSVDANALQKIELITKDIDILEDKLKYFTGKKGDEEYLELHERFVRSLIKLDNVETHGDPVVRQERKISIHRIQELMKILECLVKLPQEGQQGPIPTENSDDKSEYVIRQEEKIVNAEGKPISATAL